jgi:hypothetical protein
MKTMVTRITAPESAARLRRKRRMASAHGPLAMSADAAVEGAAALTTRS